MKFKFFSKRCLALVLSLVILITATSLSMILTSADGNEGPEIFSVALKPYSDSLGNSFLTTWSHEDNYQSDVSFTALFKDGWNNYTERFYSNNYPTAGEIYSRVAGLTPIDGNGKPVQLRNFELTFDYRVPFGTLKSYGAIWVGFRQKEAGHFFTGYATYNKEQSIARVTNTGITIANGSGLNSSALNEDAAMSADNTSWLASDGSLVTVKVKVVENTCEVGVYKTGSSEALLSYSETLDGEALQSGYLSLGIGDRQVHMINLTIKRLDEAGNVIDFTQEEVVEPDVFSVDLKPYSDSLGDSFLTTWSHEDTYKSKINFTDLFQNGWNNYTFRYYSDNYPTAGEIFSRVAGLTPLDENEQPVKLKNFELTFNYRVPIDTAKSCGAIWIGFHQKEAGHFLSGYQQYYADQSFVRVTNTGITIASGSDLYENAISEDKKMSDANTNWLAKDGSLVTVKVKVLGNKCEVGVYKSDSGEALLTYSENIDLSVMSDGYLSLGIGDRGIHMIKLEVKRLDDSGKVIDFTDRTIRPVLTDVVKVYKTVKTGTEFENIALPGKVTVSDEYGKTRQSDVTWSSEGYISNKAGKYTVYGSFPEDSLFDANGKKAVAEITVVSNTDIETFSTNFSNYGDGYGNSFGFFWNHENSYKTNLKATECFNNLANDFAERKQSSYDAGIAGEYFSRTASMSPKANGEMTTVKNFELTLDCRTPWDYASHFGAIWIGFHQQEAGHFFTGYQQFNKEQSFVRITNTGITVSSGDNCGAGGVNKEDITFANTSNLLKKGDGRFSIYVRVFSNVCYVRVYETDTGTTIGEYSEYLDESAPATGYLSIGVGDAIYAFNNLSITRYDSNGAPVDFSKIDVYDVESINMANVRAELGTEFAALNLPSTVTVIDSVGVRHSCAVTWNASEYNKDVSGSQIISGTITLPNGLLNPNNVIAQAYVYLNYPSTLEQFSTDFSNYDDSYSDLFNFYWNHETTYVTDLKATDCFNSLANEFAERYHSKYDAGLAGEYFSRTASMSPKQSDGTQARIKNFDLTLNIRAAFNTNSNYGGILVGFHQKEAGHFFTQYATYNTAQGFVRLTNSGVTVASGANISNMVGLTNVNKEDFTFNDSTMRTSDGRITLNVTVIDDDCVVTVRNTRTGDVIATYSEKIDASALSTGYLSVGVMDSVYAIDSMNIVKLDDEGKGIPFSTELPYEIVEIQDSYSVVSLGTAPTKVGLPKQVTAIDDIGVSHLVDVNWDLSSYEKNSLGTNKVNGNIVLPEGFLNTNNLKAQGTITVIDKSLTFTDTYTNNFDADDLKTALKGFESYYAARTTDNVLLDARPMTELYALKNGKLVRTESEGNMDMLSSVGMLTYTGKQYTNFQLDVDFRQGGDTWGWAMVGFGLKKPNAYFNNDDGGTLAYVEMEGYSNLLGKLPEVANNHLRETEDLVPGYSDTWATEMHHMTVIVYRFKVTLIIDGYVMLEQKLPSTYKGGYISLLSNHNCAIFDNLTIRSINTPKPLVVAVNDYNALVKFGTDVNSIALPETVKINADDEMEYSCSVSWDLSSDYNANKTGLYVFTGTLKASKEFNNPSGIKAVANIYVDEDTSPSNTDTDIIVKPDKDDPKTPAKKTPATSILKVVLITAVPGIAVLALAVFGLIVLYKKIRIKKF